MNKVEQHVASKCANYDENGLCLYETQEDGCCDCPLFSGENNRCLYFETSVLPEKPKLEREYWQARGAVYGAAATCAHCGDIYKKRSNAQKYCESCADFIRDQRRREQNARQYQKRKARQR